MTEPTSPTEATSLDEDRELRAVAALLRGLPDPEPPAALADRVMARVAEREARPKVIRLLQPFAEPALAGALAAGIGCFALYTAIQGGFFAPASESEPAPLRPMVARIVSPETAADEGAAAPNRPVMPWFASAAVIDPQVVAYPTALDPGALADPNASPQALLPSTRAAMSPQDRRLDRQLNHLMLNPIAFHERLDGIRDSVRFFDRLAARAAQRGDAAALALHLRQRLPGDDRIDWMVERLLRAALVRSVANR